eukprot:1364063-Amorphochlora_amoeboformis.AAC.1
MIYPVPRTPDYRYFRTTELIFSEDFRGNDGLGPSTAASGDTCGRCSHPHGYCRVHRPSTSSTGIYLPIPGEFSQFS